jgi:DNA-binding beta-propeller fold protein YncE
MRTARTGKGGGAVRRRGGGKMGKPVGTFVGALGLMLLAVLACAQGPGYRVLRTIPLGGEGHWDYLCVDGEARRLYIARQTHVMVVDPDTGRVVGDIPDTPGAHGIALAPELNRGFISNGKAGSVTLFDLRTLQVLGRVKAGERPDAIVFDPASRRVFVFNGRSNDVTVIAADPFQAVATLALGGHPEFACADGAGKVYVNLEDISEVAEIDSRALTVSRRFPLAPGEQPSGMSLDPVRRRIFSGCSNHMMTILDLGAGRVIGTVPIGNGVDGNGWDPQAGLAFSSNGEGTLTVVQETAPGRFEAVQTVPTQRGARTMVIDPKTHAIYLPTAQFGPLPEPTQEHPHPRPTIVKDSFVVLVVGK